MYQNVIIPYLYEAQHVSGDRPPIIRSLKLHWQPRVFYMWKVVGRVASWWTLSGTYCAWQGPPTKRLTTFHVWKTRGCQCSFRLLIKGGVSSETCWASYKYGIITFWYIVASCWIFLYEFLYTFRKRITVDIWWVQLRSNRKSLENFSQYKLSSKEPTMSEIIRMSLWFQDFTAL
jgi:hypothetical protein